MPVIKTNHKLKLETEKRDNYFNGKFVKQGFMAV